MAVGATSGEAGQQQVRLSQGTIRYVDVGEGPALLFVHGVFVNGQLWREVIRASAAASLHRPDLPSAPTRMP